MVGSADYAFRPAQAARARHSQVSLNPRFHADHRVACGRQVMVGGTNQASDLSKLRARAPDILVATPGRLNDNLTNAAVSNALKGTRSLIFDEADRLLDMGFRCAASCASRASGGFWGLRIRAASPICRLALKCCSGKPGGSLVAAALLWLSRRARLAATLPRLPSAVAAGACKP